MLAVDLDHDLYFLGRPVPEALDVLLLRRADGALAPVFTSARRARAWLPTVPPGVTVQQVPAGDPRARVELLAAFAAAGATRLGLDPQPADGAPAVTAALEPALAYLRSLRSATACF